MPNRARARFSSGAGTSRAARTLVRGSQRLAFAPIKGLAMWNAAPTRDRRQTVLALAVLAAALTVVPLPQASGGVRKPKAPSNPRVTAVTASSISLAWGSSRKRRPASSAQTYAVYRNGSRIATTTETNYTFGGLVCGMSYTLGVEAYDAAGNRSAQTSLVAATSPCLAAPTADTQPPTAPTNLHTTGTTGTSVAVAWDASTDNTGVRGYGVYRNGALVTTTTSTTTTFAGLTCGTTYTLAVDASDAAGNRSSKTVVMVPTTACADTTAPSTPTGLAVSNVTQTSLALVWSASSDNVATVGYDVYRSGTKVSTVTSPSSSQTGLACGTSYTFAVAAFDAAGNRSAQAQLTAASAACSSPAPASSGQLTGTHWAQPSEYNTLRNIGYGFAITNVAPGDLAGAKAKLDAAKAAGIKLIIGLYAFGGPEPYSYANGQWAMTQAAQDSLNYFKSRESEILAFFGFNEPYWTNQFTGQTDQCGAHSAAQLRAFRDKIRTVWPGAKIFHDLGWPSEWAPGGDFYGAYSCIGSKYADATGVADYVGIWDYPFQGTSYNRTEGIERVKKESAYVINSMGAIPVSLGQSMTEGSTPWPTKAQLQDWNCAMRAALPPQALISWYAWRQEIYNDYLVNHPDYWPLTTQAVC